MKTISKLSQTIVGTLFVSIILCLGLFLASGRNNNGVLFVNSAFAQSGGATATQWEYKVVNLAVSTTAETDLNRLGSEGWELVSAISAAVADHITSSGQSVERLLLTDLANTLLLTANQ